MRAYLDLQTTAPIDILDRPNYTYDELTDILERARAFNADQSVLKGDYYRRDFAYFTEIALRTPGVAGVFATGYPFYANRNDGTIVAIDEIDHFIGEYAARTREIDARNLGAWICTACQAENNLPDLKKFCKPCQRVEVKPRDIFKALPDLDFWVIVDDSDEYKLSDMQENMRRGGFLPSDPNIAESIKTTDAAMRSILEGGMPQEHLPIDLHTITIDDLSEAMHKLRHAIKHVYTGENYDDTFVPIAPRSLHIAWDISRDPYDFTKDYLLSLTWGEYLPNGLAEQIARTNETIRECLSPHDIHAIVSRHPKESRQLESREVAAILVERWKV